MPRKFPPLAQGIVLIAVAMCGTGLLVMRRANARDHARWQAQVDWYRAELKQGATRGEVEGALDRTHVGWQKFSGGMIEPGVSTFKEQTMLGARPNRMCGTTVYAYAVFAYRARPSAEVITDTPTDVLDRISLEEVDSCGAL